MIAYEVYVNSEKVCTAGGSELSVLSAGVNFFPNRPDKLGPQLTVSGVVTVGGVDYEPEEFLHWGNRGLRPGDRVEIVIVEASKADEPISRDRPGRRGSGAEPGASPNGGPAMPAGNSGVLEGPPSGELGVS
jgi:hypothetical protein